MGNRGSSPPREIDPILTPNPNIIPNNQGLVSRFTDYKTYNLAFIFIILSILLFRLFRKLKLQKMI